MQQKKPGNCRAFSRCKSGSGCCPYFEDFFEELLLDEVDLRADDFADDFFAPLFEPERDDVAFFADLEAPDLDLEALFDELFLLVAGDLAIAVILSFPSKQGTGIASPAVVKKPSCDGSRLIA